MPVLMKGHRWLDRKDKRNRDGSHVVQYPVYAEIKYDEIRCHVRVHNENVEFLSYAGKPLANMQGFDDKFLRIAHLEGYCEFDCGFLVNNNFNDSYRWVRSTKGIPEDLRVAHVEFILFDIPSNSSRYEQRVVSRDLVALRHGLQVPVCYICKSEAEVDAKFLEVREAGFEGLMIKSRDHVYEPGKRTDGWLKYKPSDDEAGVIVAINQAFSLDGLPLGRAGSVLVQVADGSTASPGGIDHALGRDMWEHTEKYIGRTIDFKFMERDRQGGYRHPTFVRFREAV